MPLSFGDLDDNDTPPEMNENAPIILSEGEHKVTVVRTVFLTPDDDNLTIGLIMEDVKKGAEIVSWIGILDKGVKKSTKGFVLRKACEAFGVSHTPDTEIDEDFVSQFVGRSGRVETFVLAAKGNNPAKNRVRYFLSDEPKAKPAPTVIDDGLNPEDDSESNWMDD